MSDVVAASDIQPITKIPRSGLPALALVVGDPARATRIAEVLDGARQIGSNREYVTYRGSWKGADLVVASHGIGGSGAICLFQELFDGGVTTCIRLGTAGAMVPGLEDGDLVIADAAVRDDGVTHQLVPETYPSSSTPEVVLALTEAARSRQVRAHRGIVWTRSLFYPGLVPLPTEALTKSNVIAIEMELSALLVLAATRGIRSGGLLVIDGVSADDQPYNPHKQAVAEGVARGTEVALDALCALDTPG